MVYYMYYSGGNPLLCLLYETDAVENVEDTNHLELIPRMWRFREPMSLAHLRREFEARDLQQNETGDHNVLRLFLQEVRTKLL